MTYVTHIYVSKQHQQAVVTRLMIPCEVAVKSVVPAVKALLANELLKTEKLNQMQVAEILGVSQSAVSKYNRGVRGRVIPLDKVDGLSPLVDNIIELVSQGNYQRSTFIEAFCRICANVRKSRLMCPYCQDNDAVEAKRCDHCVNPTHSEPRYKSSNVY